MTIVLTKLQHSQIESKSKNKLQSFQRKIYLKAKTNPKYKFYCLYDKIYRKDFLKEAYKKVKANKGIGGVDGVQFKDIREEEFINEIHEELKNKTYVPNRLKEIKIPKKNGKTRVLRIPTIKDRVVQMVVKQVIEPIFEAGFKECSYGYRPNKSAEQAIGKLSQELYRDLYKKEEERKEVKSIDMSDCFNKIPQKELMEIIANKIIDRQTLKIIKKILKAGTIEEGEEKRGTPQGGVLSPLLANIYLDKIDEYWEGKGKKSAMLRYADDIIIVLNQGEEEEYEKLLKYLEEDMKMVINREKSKTGSIGDGIEYLGFVFREKRNGKGKKYLAKEPSKEAMKRIRKKIKEIVRPRMKESTEEIIMRVNRVLRGWQQYYDNVGMGKTRGNIRWYTEQRVAKLISKRKKKKKVMKKIVSGNKLYEKYGLYKLENLGRKFG